MDTDPRVEAPFEIDLDSVRELVRRWDEEPSTMTLVGYIRSAQATMPLLVDEIERLRAAADAVDDGWEPVTIDADERPKTSTLLFALIIPDGEPPEGIDHASLADMMADEFAEIINEERRANGGSAGDVLVSGIPMPQFLTSNTMARYKAADAVLSGKEVRVRRSVTPSETPLDKARGLAESLQGLVTPPEAPQ